MKDAFINTFKNKAIEWYLRYKLERFGMYNEVVVAFLQRYWWEKSSSQLCDKIRSLKQDDMDVETYAFKMLCMRQRVEDTLNPSINNWAEWFINGLELVRHATVNTRIVEREEDFEAVIVEAKIPETKAQQKKGDKSRKRHSSALKHASSLEDSSSFSSSSSSSYDSEEGKKKMKKNFKEKKTTMETMKEM